MTILTLAQIASHATRMASNPLAQLSFVSEYVNLAYAHVSQAAWAKHGPKEQIAFASTSTSDNRLAFPSNYDYALGLKVGFSGSNSTATSRTTSWEPLAKAPAPWDDPYQSGDSGQPRFYAEYATWFELRPSPSSAYSVELRYMRKISDLTTSTSTPLLDEQWHWAIALKAAELLAASSERTELEAANRNRYGIYVQSVRLDYTRRRLDERGMHVAYVRTQR